MSDARPPARPRADVELMPGYHSPQVTVEVRLNTNESPEPPPPAFLPHLASAMAHLRLNRYPDREASALREAIGLTHGVGPEQVWCGNGSNEVIQGLLLAYGGAGRSAVVFEPTYALHSHISRITDTDLVVGERDAGFLVAIDEADRLLAGGPSVTFLCSPNNPTARAESTDTIRHLLGTAPGLVVVDEAYGQFAEHSALELRSGAVPPGDADRLVVVRTFSKTWALAGLRLGYLVAAPEVVEAVARVTLPYHLDELKQLAGRLALGYEEEMRERVGRIVEARRRLIDSLVELPVDVWPSDANFVLFRPLERSGREVWGELLAQSVLVRDVSGWPRLEDCLRVTVGTPEECSRFLSALTLALA